MNTFKSEITMSDDAVWDTCEALGFKRTTTVMEKADGGFVEVTESRTIEDAVEYLRGIMAVELMYVVSNTNNTARKMDLIREKGNKGISFINMGDRSKVNVSVTSG